MNQWFKKHFIPHKANNYQPHFLRTKATVAIFALILFAEVIYLGNIFLVFPKSDYFAAIFATVLVNQTNAKRLEGELGLLTPNPLLEKAAQLKAADMARKGYFAHVTPDGKEPWYWFEEAGYKYLAAGENLAVNFTDSTDVTNAWMQSPTHRANIMNGNYTEIGIATAEGVYKGRNVIFVVQEFGRPAPLPVATAEVERPLTRIAETAVASVPVATVKSPVVPTAPKPVVVQQPVPTVPPVAPVVTTSTPPSVVAGAETATIVAETLPPLETVTPSLALPQTASPVSVLVAAPRHAAMLFYLVLGALLTLALSLAIFIEIRIQHARIIWNGVLLISLIGALIMLNATLGAGVVVGA